MHIREMTVILIALALAAGLAACAASVTPAEPSATETLRDAPATAPASQASALIDTVWDLASLQGQSLLPGTQISLRFEGDRFSSFAGCNTLGGKYAATDPGTFSLPELELTMELCPEPEGVMEQEKVYVAAFTGAATFRLVDDRLELQDATGQAVLVYERVLPGPTGGVLPGTKWVLTSLRGQPVLQGTVINLEFGDRSLGGYTGCNFYNGGFDSGPSGATGDGTFTIRSFEVTVRECREGIVAQEQEKAYIEALTSTVSYRLEADRLELGDATGETVLVYTRRAECAEEPAKLAGTAWQLVSVDGREPASGSATSLVFLDDKWFVEYSKCEGVISSYQVTGHDLEAAFSASLGRVCQDEEGPGVTALEVPADYCLAQGRLQITTVPGQVFAYEPLPEATQPPLEGPTWSLLSIVGARQIEGEPVPWPDPAWLVEGTEITVAFTGGTASGSAGCNGYGATYTVDGTWLDFGDIAATEKGCLTPEGVMEQEQRYLGALKDVTNYYIYGSLLWLWTEDGRGLALTAQGTKP